MTSSFFVVRGVVKRDIMRISVRVVKRYVVRGVVKRDIKLDSSTVLEHLSDPDRFAVRCQDVSTETVSNHNIQMLRH